MEALDLRGLVPAPVTPFTRDGDVDHAAIQRLGSWLGSFDGVKGLVVLGHAGEGTFLTPDEQAAVIRSFVEVGRRQAFPSSPASRSKAPRSPPRRQSAPSKAGADGRPRLPVARLAALRLPEGRAAGSLPRDLRGERPAADPVPVSGRDQGDLQPRHPARDRGAAGRVRHEERRAQHAPLGHRDSGRPPRAPEPADPHLPRRISAAHDVRRRRRAGRLRRPCPRAADRADRRRQGEGLREGARDPRPAAAGDGSVYHRGSHMEGTVALKHGLVARGILEHATVRSPLLPLEPGAEVEIADALRSAGLGSAQARGRRSRRGLTATRQSQRQRRRSGQSAPPHTSHREEKSCLPLPQMAPCRARPTPRPFHAAANAQLVARLERLPVTPQADAASRDRRHRDVLRRLHGAGHRLRDAAARVRMEAHADRGRHDHLGGLCRPALRRGASSGRSPRRSAG